MGNTVKKAVFDRNPLKPINSTTSLGEVQSVYIFKYIFVLLRISNALFICSK
jgi:hypothetical protein